MQKQLTCILLAAMLVLGCAPMAKVESNIRPGYNKKIESIYVVSSTGNAGSPEFTRALLTSLNAKFDAVAIKSKAHVRNPLSLTEAEDMKNEMDAFHPGTVMYLIQTSRSVSSGGSGSFGGAVFEIALHERGEEVPFWKAIVETQAPNASWSHGGVMGGGFGAGTKVGDPKLTADRIFEKLQADGLVGVSVAK